MYAHIREEMQFFPHIPSPISDFVRCAKLKHVSELRSQETTFYFSAERVNIPSVQQRGHCLCCRRQPTVWKYGIRGMGALLL